MKRRRILLIAWMGMGAACGSVTNPGTDAATEIDAADIADASTIDGATTDAVPQADAPLAPDAAPDATTPPDATRCYALHFSGSDYVGIPDSDSLAGGGPMTIEAWIRAQDPGGVYPNLIGKRDTSANYPPWVLGFQNDLGLYSVKNDGWAYASEPIPLDVWTHVAVVFDGSELRFYIDGVPGTSFTTSAMGPANNEGVYIGTIPSGSQNYTGDIAAIRVSKSARYSGAFTPVTYWTNDANTLLLLRLEEGTGTSVGDSSSNNNDGEITGATWISECP